MTDMRDELLQRIVGELRTLPPVDEAAVGRIVQAAQDDAVRGPRGYPPQAGGAVRGPWWRSRVPLAAAAGFALAAGVGGYAIRGGGSSAPLVAAESPAAESLTLTSAHRPPAPRVPARTGHHTVATQFVLDAPKAARVALVGDFNGWDAAATPLVRDPSSGIWTATVPLPPGRHVYAFMVDGKVWTLDPRAPTAQDRDYGTPSSVVLVGAP